MTNINDIGLDTILFEQTKPIIDTFDIMQEMIFSTEVEEEV